MHPSPDWSMIEYSYLDPNNTDMRPITGVDAGMVTYDDGTITTHIGVVIM